MAYIYVARNCKKVSGQNLDDMEFLNVERYSAEEIEKMISEGNFKQAMHVMAWLMAIRNK